MQESFEDPYDPKAMLSLNADFISPECLEALSLDENPFIDHAREPFLFIDQQLEMSINVVLDYLQKKNSTLVLLGEIGIGKTTHLRILLRRGYQHFNFCTLRAKPNTTFAEIEQKVRERWRLPEQTIEETIQSDEYIKRYIETDKHPVLIVDDAHRLQSQVLDALLQLKHRVGLQSPHPLGLVLASEPSIRTQLAELEQINLAATQVHQINTHAFNATQSENYINFRLEKAGVKNTDLFSPHEIQEFFTHSKGLPRVINKLARAALMEQCQKESTRTTANNNFAATPGMRLGLILVGLIGLTFVFAALLKEPNEDIELEINQDELKQEVIQSKIIEPDEQTKNQIARSSHVQKIPKPYVAPLVLGPLHLEDTTATKDKQDKQTKILYKSQPFAPDWLLTQKSESYTIQIVASPSQENLTAFAAKHFKGKQTAYYQKTSQDKQWFILVYGIYPTRKEALTAIEALPSSVKKNRPYPLKINKIQHIIRQ